MSIVLGTVAIVSLADGFPNAGISPFHKWNFFPPTLAGALMGT
jgi:hypothetical protein